VGRQHEDRAGQHPESLRTVAGLERGRTTARETEPVKPIDAGCVNAVLPNVSPPVAAMIQLQQLTGMRAGEVVIMRPQDIDRSRPI
jgi:integrase